MSDRSAIEWTDASWNPVTGCSKVSPGCAPQAAAARAGESEYVFPASRGGPRDGSRVGKRWRELRDAVGLPGVRFHDLRHQTASLMLADLRSVMHRLRHSQIALTANTYGHITQSADQDAADRMDAFLGH